MNGRKLLLSHLGAVPASDLQALASARTAIAQQEEDELWQSTSVADDALNLFYPAESDSPSHNEKLAHEIWHEGAVRRAREVARQHFVEEEKTRQQREAQLVELGRLTERLRNERAIEEPKEVVRPSMFARKLAQKLF